jgi:hypothetical protein
MRYGGPFTTGDASYYLVLSHARLSGRTWGVFAVI